jgi:hypothetical protein
MVINFAQGRNFYHTLKEKILKADGVMCSGEAKITGFTRIKFAEGAILNINKVEYHVVSVLRRDHRGKFENPTEAVNGYFEAECTFTKPISTKL